MLKQIDILKKRSNNFIRYQPTFLLIILFLPFQALAQIWGCTFIESSAKSRMNVNEVFAEIVREMNQKSYSKDREIVCTCCVIS